MHIDTMRRIDRWAGIPLTWLLTLLLRLRDVIKDRNLVQPRHILLIELSEMGSTILADPAMRKLRQRLPCQLYFAIFHKNRSSLDLLGTVPPGHIFTLREENLFLLLFDTLRFLFWTRRHRIDTVIDLELFSRFTALLTGASGAANRVGFSNFNNEGLYRGKLLTHQVWYNPHIHIAKNFLALVNALLAPQAEYPFSKTVIDEAELILPVLTFTAQEQEAMQARLCGCVPGYQPDRHRLVLINPNASELLPQRRWMPERYIALITKILEADQNILVLITGAPGEQQEAAAMCQAVGNSRCCNFAGGTSLQQLPLLYSLAELMVTNDSGPGHFSAITAMPTFVLFGPETPALYGSLGNSTPIYAGLACSPCVSAANHRKTPCTDNVCLKAITVEQVFALIAPLLPKQTR